MIEYTLTTPGVHTLIIGIGQIDDDPMKCQLVQNFYASQIEPDGMSADDRKRIEDQARKVKANSNYFQMEKVGLTAPEKVIIAENKVTWNTAFSGDHPISHYEVMVDGEMVGKVEHKPQVLKSKPFAFELEKTEGEIVVASVDTSGNRAELKMA